MFLTAAMAAASVGFISAKNDLVSVDSLHVMQESKEGKVLAEKLKAKINDYQEFVKRSQQELASLQEDITKKADMLSKDALQDKTDQLARKKKDLERILADKEETLKAELQKEQIKLRDKQLAVANSMCQEKDWGIVIDKNTPGVLFVNKAIDKTDDLLKKVDELYEQPALNSISASNKPVVANNKTKQDTKKA